VFGHIGIMRGLAPCQRNRGSGCKGRICAKGRAAKGLFQPGRAVGRECRQAEGGGLDILAEDLAGIDQQDAILTQSGAGRLKVTDILFQVEAEGCPAELGRRKACSADRLGPRAGLFRRCPEKHRGIRKFRMRPILAEQAPDRFVPRAAEDVPKRDLHPRPSVRGLQQVHRVIGHVGGHGGNILGTVQCSAKDRSPDRPTGAMRHGRDPGGDRRKRGRLAFAPADMSASADTDHKGVLAAIGGRGDLGHGKVEEINGIDAHFGLRVRRE
jgi:hypothetical protein